MGAIMELITWYDKYSVNNEEFDSDHKMFFDLINRLYKNCTIKPIATYLANKLVCESFRHIAKEEQYMESIGFKEIHEHLYENKIFIQKVLQLQQAVNENDTEHTIELIAYLAYWLLHHIMEDDKKLAVGCE